jgi:sulfite reductase alpha subunit-like flavoprotein
MTAKLHINMAQGIVDVEGDVEFVRKVYEDFKDRLLSSGFSADPDDEEKPKAKTQPIKTTNKPKSKPRKPSPSKAKNSSSETGTNPDSPTLDKNLDTSALPGFYAQFAPKNNQEKILIFLKFMVDELGLESPNTDQFYTCFDAVKERIPQAFRQAFLDTSGKRFGYIDYSNADGVTLTIKGKNHFDSGIKKKTDE